MTLLLWILGAVVVPLGVGEFTELCPWLARNLIRRAARRIPEQERARWEAEWVGELASKPGRLTKLAWALWRLPLLWGAGEMGRMLGVPPVSAVLRARLRAAWQRLRLRKAPHDQAAVPEQPARVVELAEVGVAADALAVTKTVAARRRPPSARRPRRRPTGLPHLTDRQFVAWLAQQRADFDHHVDRQTEEAKAAWRRANRGEG